MSLMLMPSISAVSNIDKTEWKYHDNRSMKPTSSLKALICMVDECVLRTNKLISSTQLNDMSFSDPDNNTSRNNMYPAT